jgi:hypothetical protein
MFRRDPLNGGKDEEENEEIQKKSSMESNVIKSLIVKETKLKLISNILQKEYIFVLLKNEPGGFIRSRFQQNITPNLNGFQRLNLLLDRVI